METKRLKKGEKLFDEKDILENIYLVKSGRLTIYIERNNKKVEMGMALTGHVVGDKALFTKAKAGFSAMANMESSVLVIPVSMIKPHVEGVQPVAKMLLKGMSDRMGEMAKTVMTLKMESDTMPCSERQITRVFGIIALYFQQAGKKDPRIEKPAPNGPKIDPKDPLHNLLEVSWHALKLNATRMYLESPVRLQQAIEILTKLKYAEMHYEKDENEDDVLTTIKLNNVNFVRDFADFYQYNYYKGGAAEILVVDEMAMKICNAIVEVSKDEPLDHKGGITMSFDKVLSEMKSKFRIELKTNHLELLEKKGLFATKKSRDEGIYLQFDRSEFARTYSYWQILKEIDKWNAQGFIVMKEEEVKVADENACPECKTAFKPEQKFCGNCGFKFAA